MNLTNHFLIAMPHLDDPFFENSLIYLCEHNDDGAMGIMINKPSPISMDIVFGSGDKPTPERFKNQFVLMGGPVQVDRGFVVHSPVGEWRNSLPVNENIAMTTSSDVIESLGENDQVDKALLSIGYSTWSKGQLEKEILENNWLTVEADEQILFDIPCEARYNAALAKLGVRPETLVGVAGHA